MSRSGGSILARLGFTVKRMGWPFHLALILGAGAAVFQLAMIEPGRAQLAELKQDAALLKSRAAAPASEGPAAGIALPPESRLPEMVRTVLDAAQKNGVALERGEYRQNREGGVLRVRVVLPVKGAYPQIRAWLAEVMNTLPTAALEDMNLGRNAAAEAAVEGRVRLALYLEGKP